MAASMAGPWLVFGEFLLLRAVMMAAMMLPPVAPVASMYLTVLRNRRNGTAAAHAAALAAGYLLAWAGCGVAAFGISRALGTLAPMGTGTGPSRLAVWSAAIALAVAGAYQFTPLKARCLRRCRPPPGFLLRFGNCTGRLRDCRLQHARQAAFLTALDKAAITAGLATGEALNLDFHAVMHWGDDPVLEKHYVPRRSQRTRSVLTFFAEDAGTHTLLYANADLSKATQNREVIAFADHWKAVTGSDPALLIFDSKLTTQAVLAELDDRKIGFITLRARHPGTTKTLAALPASAWKPMTPGRAGNKTRRIRVHDDPAAQLSAYPRPIRQLAVTGLGHDQPTLLITNQPQLPARQVISSYARRMNIEQRLAEAISSFSLDALAGAVPLNVDLDVVLSVLAHTLCAALRRRLPGYHAATPGTLQRRFLNTGGIIENDRRQITIRLARRTYSPILRQATLPETITVPWRDGRTLRYQYD